MKARLYQTQCIESVLSEYQKGIQRTLAILPTGAGKTVVAGMIGKLFLELVKGKRVMVLAHRDELIRQAADKFETVTGIRASIEKAEEWSNENDMYGKPPLVIASIQTMNSGKEKKRMERFDPKEFAFLWVDECHHIAAESWKTVIEFFCKGNPELKLLGVTATADRADGQGLGSIFQSIAFEYGLRDIIDDGYLVPIRQRCVMIEGLDFSKVRTTAGDLNAGDLEAAMMFEKPLHGVAHATIEMACEFEADALTPLREVDGREKKIAEMLAGKLPRKTLIFAASVAHAERLSEIINRWLPASAASLDGTMSKELRKSRLADFASGRIRFLANCMVATEGFDEPSIELVVMARPTKSRPLYAQQVGRGTRPLSTIAHELGDLETADDRRKMIADSAKSHIEILDFAGNAGRHRLVTTVDILGGEYKPEEIELAKEMTVGDGAVDTAEALEKAREELERKRREAEEKKRKAEEAAEKRRQADAARRARLVGTSTYTTEDVDGFDQYSPRFDRQSSMKDAPTEAMVRTLLALGQSREKIEGYSKKQAGTLIGILRAKGVQPDWSRVKAYTGIKTTSMQPGCTPAQQTLLRRLGHSETDIRGMTFADAMRAIKSRVTAGAA